MTSRADDIHKLIADIDNLLSSSGNRLSRLLSGQSQEDREVLQQIRDFLLKLDETEASADNIPNASTSQPLSSLLAQFVGEGNHQSTGLGSDQSPPVQTQPLSTQLNSEFSHLLQPLQTELSALLQERASLIQEIRQLEQRRLQNYSLTQQLVNQEQMISEFLQVLMGRLLPNLSPHLNNSASFNGLDNEHSQPNLPNFLGSSEQVERLVMLARELDQRLLSLDGTVNLVFDALQRNIKTYHQSLSQALSRMHSQGMQGEQLMTNFLNNLTQYLQQQSLTIQSFLPESPPEGVVAPETDSSLDTLFSELTIDQSGSLEAATVPEPVAQTPFPIAAGVNDEVDQLYASLFGTKDVIADNLELDDTVLDITETGQPNVPLVLTEPPNRVPAWEDLFFTEETTPPTEASKSVQPTDLVSFQVDSSPSGDDTIIVLTDLLIDVSQDERSLEVPYLGDTPETIVGETPIIPTSTVPPVPEDLNPLSLDNYIPASPQENLLSLPGNDTANVPDINLDRFQWEQLTQDLANFDQRADFPEESPIIQNLSTPDPYLAPSISGVAPEILETPTTVPTLNIPQFPPQVDLEEITEKKYIPPIPTSLSDLPEDDSLQKIPVSDSVWYLGIDLGTTGISATLLNRTTSLVYPIYWSTDHQPDETPAPRSFRLPAEVYLPLASVPPAGTEGGEALDQTPISVSGVTSDPVNNLYSAQLKPYLQVAIPYKNTRQKWEPVLQLNEFSAGPLIWVVRSLSKLLITLKAGEITTTPALIAHGVGLDSSSFTEIIHNITGVICTCPSIWSEQYRFNLREAILITQLVSHPQQIFFIEEAIATLLPELNSPNSQVIQLSSDQGPRPLKTSEHPLFGNTLAINIGANATEMALVDLSAEQEQLTHQDFMLHSFVYGGKGIEQDIICQLLLPPKSRQSRLEIQIEDKTNTSNSWHWQPAIPGLDQMQLSTLALEKLELPRVGEPDIPIRIRLQQHLESSLLGHALLDAALALKLILQHQDSFTLELADQRWILQRRDLESQVFVPFVRRLNRELNKLLVARGIPTEAINQAVLTGGVASVGTINRWLRQKLPNAKIIQDTYLDPQGAPNCSRVAYGLAVLPLHHQILETARQQYPDYFLFNELLKILPERSLSFGELLQLFENRGVNTRTCQQRLLAFLEGELPAGLVPSSLESTWLTENSRENSDYQEISTTPLFEKQGNLTYRPNFPQISALRHYMNAIKSTSLQSLEEPYIVNFGLHS